jgi:pyridoxal phosphate enzyme (YggS family)
MAITPTRLKKNLDAVRQRVAAAAVRSGREADDVTLVSVTKSVEAPTIRNVLKAGAFTLGENRVQPLLERIQTIDAYTQRCKPPLAEPVKWHFIGHLQRNKLKSILGKVEMIHSVDSLRLAEDIDERAARMGLTVEVLMQVNCSLEEQKYGVSVGASMRLAEVIAEMPHVTLAGLMTMAAYDPDPEQARPTFARLRELFEEMQHAKIGGDTFRHLSMGMSGDFEVAIEEGATIVRVGSALFI